MRTSYGYDTYRGRSKLRTALTVLIVILFVALLLAVAAFFLLQKYMVYTDDGQARLDLPFLQRESTPSTPIPTPDQGNIVVVTPEPTLTPEPTPEPVRLSPVRPVSLFRSAVTDGAAARQVTAAGGDAALLNMKANDGTLGYVSGLDRAKGARASAVNSGFQDKLLTLTASELYTIARVSCFKDNLIPRVEPTLAIKSTGGNNWRDGGDVRWLSPSSPEARQYVTDVCVELAQLGFDEILLDNAAWPTTGRLDSIRQGEDYDPDHLTETAETFYQEVRQALADADVTLSIAVTAAALEESDPSSGQTAALLAQYADRVYVLGAEGDGACDAALDAVGLSGGRVVYVNSKSADLSTSGGLILFPQR